jgi:hypothetical protein
MKKHLIIFIIFALVCTIVIANATPEEAMEAARTSPDGRALYVEYINNKPHGPLTLYYATGTNLTGNYDRGTPSGAFSYKSSESSFTTMFLEGVRYDDEMVEANIQLNHEIENIIIETQKMINESGQTKNVDDNIELIKMMRQKIFDSFIIEQMLYEAGLMHDIKPMFSFSNKKFALEDVKDLKFDVPNKEPLVIKRTSFTPTLKKGSVGLSIKGETITEVTEPVKEFSNFMGLLGFSYFSFMGYDSVSALAGLNYRNFKNSGKNFPGIEGGKGSGFDLRMGINGMMNEDYIDGSVQATLGYTWFNFKQLDQATLKQKGSGFSLGIGAQYGFTSESISPVPLISFDGYDYNPQTAKYSSWTLGGMFWPDPFMLSISYGFSF